MIAQTVDPDNSQYRPLQQEPDEKIKNKVLGIKLKYPFEKKNLLAIIIAQCTVSYIGVYLNVAAIYLLRNQDYFNVSSDYIGRVSSDLVFYSQLCHTVFSIVIGYIYDIFGRKKTILFSMFLSGILLILMPRTAPNLFLFTLFRIGIVCALSPLSSCPLINDYVTKDSRGKAIAFQNMGTVIGDLITFVGILTLTVNMSPNQQFMTVGLLTIVTGFSMIYFITEPDIQSLQTANHKSYSIQDTSYLLLPNEQETKTQEAIRLTKHAFKLTTTNIVFPICYIGNILSKAQSVLLGTFVYLWVISFIESGVIASEEESQQLIQKINVISIVVASISFIPAGRIADQIPAKVILPLSYFIMGICLILFYQLETPGTLSNYVIGSLIVSSLLFMNTCLDSLFAKNLPKDIRGTMYGIYTFFGILGTVAFAKIGGIIFDLYGPQAPFLVVAFLNLLFAIILISLGVGQKFNY